MPLTASLRRFEYMASITQSFERLTPLYCGNGMQALFESALDYKIVRYQVGDDRWYCVKTHAGELFAVPGVTHVTRKVAGSPEYLEKWRMQEIAEGRSPDRHAYERACYGSLMHSQFVPVYAHGCYDFRILPELVGTYAAAKGCPHLAAAWLVELQKDILAKLQWMQDVKAITYFVELPLWSRTLGVATAIDWFGITHTKKGIPVLTVVDEKSSKKPGKSHDHAYQLAFGAALIRENFPQLAEQFASMSVAGINWHPKDWRDAPTYTEQAQREITLNQLIARMREYQEMVGTTTAPRRLRVTGTQDVNKPLAFQVLPLAAWVDAEGGFDDE